MSTVGSNRGTIFFILLMSSIGCFYASDYFFSKNDGAGSFFIGLILIILALLLLKFSIGELLNN